MSMNIEDNRKKWPTPSTDWKVGSDEVDAKKVWEPPSSYDQGGQYAKVRAWTFRAGHSVEVDETKEGERIRVIHPAGSYIEMNPDGSVTFRSNGNSFEVVAKDKNLKVKGSVHIHVEGDAFMKVDGDMRQEVGGDYYMTVGGKTEWKDGGRHQTETPYFHVLGDAMAHNSRDNGDTHRHEDVMAGTDLSGLPTPDHGG